MADVNETQIEIKVEPVYARYLGDGYHFITGVPARDLTQAEWDAVRGDLQILALDSGLYELKGKKSAKATTAVIKKITAREKRAAAKVEKDAAAAAAKEAGE